jgi:geranyl-CoA carboxylase alpha subunit
VGDEHHRFEVHELNSGSVRFGHGGVTKHAALLRDGDRLCIQLGGVPLAVTDLTMAAPKAAATSGGDGKVRAAMNGRVVALLVKQGDRVTLGQPVMTLEAMKMEHVHKAGIDGVVTTVDAADGEQVTTGRIVLEIAPA